MLRNLRSRRRPRYGAQICAAISALLLLVSVSLLYSRLSFSAVRPHLRQPQHDVSDSKPLLSDSDVTKSSEDKIDGHDIVEGENEQNDTLDPEDLVRGAAAIDDDDHEIDRNKAGSSSGFYFDHVMGVLRRAINKRSIVDWEDDYAGFNAGLGEVDGSKLAIGSDDVPVDEEVRRKASEVMGIEDALLLKTGKRVSPLREGWGDWFDKKGDFLRRDRMFKYNFEVLNPLNNPMLQDPDGVGVTVLTRGDRAVRKRLLTELKKVPFLGEKTLEDLKMTGESDMGKNGMVVETLDSNVAVKSENRKLKMGVQGNVEQRNDIKGAERRRLDHNTML